MKAYQIEVLTWSTCPKTITGHLTAGKARYEAFKVLREIITGITFMDIRVIRSPDFDEYADKMEGRFLEPNQIQSIFN